MLLKKRPKAIPKIKSNKNPAPNYKRQRRRRVFFLMNIIQGFGSFSDNWQLYKEKMNTLVGGEGAFQTFKSPSLRCTLRCENAFRFIRNKTNKLFIKIKTK